MEGVAKWSKSLLLEEFSENILKKLLKEKLLKYMGSI